MSAIQTRCGTSLLLLVCFGSAATASDDFEKHVRPLLVEKCQSCHGAEKQKAGLRLDSKAGWQNGGDSGPAIVPGKPDRSLLIQAIRGEDGVKLMPPMGKLSDREIALLTQWVKDGAADPRNGSEVRPQAANWDEEFQKRLNWWSLQPLRPVKAPKDIGGDWSREPIDRFIKLALDDAKLRPAPLAEPEVLLRRLAFVLTGLPPAPAVRERFLKSAQVDPAKAYEQLVDDLLASPHFGERFARHWMDVVRYTDTYGYEWDNPAKGSHEYRDYLIRAFNGDLPYDQFVREQLAGDLLTTPRINHELAVNESLIGPMFYHLGEHRHGSSFEFNGVHQEMVNNKIDAFSKAFLATTVGCSRCHDHKLEAVSQRDYYALGAVFMTPRWTSRVVDAPGKNDAAIARLRKLRADIRAEMAKEWARAEKQPSAWPVKNWQAALPPKPALEDIAYPLARLTAPGDPAASWNTLVAEWRAARESRTKHNQAFTVVADFAKPGFPAGWVAEGDGIRFGHVEDGTPLIALEGGAVFARLLPRGYHTHALSSKLPGALRMPPDRVVPGSSVSLKLAGGQFGGSLEVHENAFQGEEVRFFTNVQPQWRTYSDRKPVHGIVRFRHEFATSSLNPNFPPRTGLAAGLPNNDFGFDKRSWISVTEIVAHDGPAAPQEMLEPFGSLYLGEAPKTAEDVHRKVSAWFSGAVVRWCEEKPRPGDQQILDWLLTNKLLPNAAAPGSELAKLLAGYRRVEQAIAFPRTVNGMDERETAKAGFAFNARGNVDAIGEFVPPDFLRMFAGRHGVAKSTGSGRLELAESLLQPSHPAHRSRVRQPRLAVGHGRRPRRHAGRFRAARRETDAPRGARLPGERVDSRGLVHEEARAAARAVADLPPGGHGERRSPRPRSRQPPATPLPDAPARSRGRARQPVGGRRSARSEALRSADPTAARRRGWREAAVRRAARWPGTAFDLPANVDHGAAQVPRRLQPA